MKNLLSDIQISSKASIQEAMRSIDEAGMGIIFVVDKDKKLLGVVTDGDIRKAILKGVAINEPVIAIANKKPALIRGRVTQRTIETFASRKDILPSGGSLKVPVIDAGGRIKDILFLYADERKNIVLSKLSKEQESPPAGVRKILIVGGAGYLGSVLTRLLLAEKMQIRVLDNLSYGDHGIRSLRKRKNFHFLEGDCGNISHLIQAMKGMDAVIHLAAIVGDPACALNPEETLKTNYLSTKLIAESAKFNQINKFLFISSCSVYGASKNKEPLTESSSLNPVSLYAKTKIHSEEAVLSMADGNFSPTIFRFATLYGVSPRMRFDLVVNALTAQAYNEKRISIFGGSQYRPFLEVSDAARACFLWVKSPLARVGKEIFNIGSDEQNHRIAEVGSFIKQIIPETSIEVKKKKEDKRDYYVSFRKARDTIGFIPQNTLLKSIAEIRKLFDNEIIKDYTHPKYNNHKFLQA